jgi:Cu+-exporting ATPase
MLVSALAAARRGVVGVELLISAGSLAAIGASARATVHGSFVTYYDSGTMILVLVTLGGYLDAKARERASAALRGAVGEATGLARVRRIDGEREVPAESVGAGDIVLVRAGERVPADGTVAAGSSDVEEAALTGESVPRRVGVGDRVFSGSTALDGALEIVSTGVTETLAIRVHRVALEARARRAPIAVMADRIAAAFVPAVMAVSVGSLFFWGAFGGDWRRGALAALSVLVVACPCALGLATPLATTVALTRAASRGTIVRSGQALETLARVGTVVFDKTGTLTRGHPTVSSSSLCDQTLAAVAAVERGIVHPFAAAVVAEADRRGLPVLLATEVRAIPGGGAEGRVGGADVLVGSRRFLRERGIEVPDSESAETELACAVGGRFAGASTLSDPLRPEARATVSKLAAEGLAIALLSGDREPVVREIARSLGITDARSGLSPSEKSAEIARRRARRGNVIAMVGDGVNDAAALDAANVGIAFGAAADLAREHAAVTVLGEDLGAVYRLYLLARRTLRTIRVNLFWAFFYNVIGVGLAAAGRLSPILAAGAMVASSLVVVGNSSRLRTTKI